MARSPRTALAGALLCAVGVAVTGLLSFGSPAFSARDQAAQLGLAQLNRPWLSHHLADLGRLADPAPYCFLGLILIAMASGRGRPRVALGVAGLLVSTGATTYLLKQLTAAPRGSGPALAALAPASWPSGHATASMTLALCAVLAVPAHARPTAAAIGALYAFAVSTSVVALGHHLPSDVLAGYLVATGWTLLGVAGLAVLDRRRPAPVAADGPPAHTTGALAAPAFVAGGALTALVIAVAARPRTVTDVASSHTTAVVVLASLAVLAVLLPALLVRSARV